MALDDYKKKTVAFGVAPPAEHPINNKFMGTGNPDQGEKISQKLLVEGNRFPRETGHDSLTEEEAQLS